MKIYIGADYRGYELKQAILGFLARPDAAELIKTGVPGMQPTLEVVDVGVYEPHEGGDYNDAAVTVAKQVREDFGARGILICESAHGMTMQANRFKGVRAANCDSAESAKLAREHDDANVLCLGARFTNFESAKEIISAFLGTTFADLERRVRRINRLDEREDYA